MNFTEIFNGMVGKDFISAFNDNFRISNNTFLDILATLLYKVKSTDIKEFKVIDGVVSYTLEELEEGEEDNRTWTPVDITKWGNINGNLSDQTDLQEALDSKAAADVVSEMDNILSTLRLEFNNLRDDYEDTEVVVEANKNDIANLKEVDKTKVSSINIKGIRVSDAEFQWTLDNITWYAMPKTTSISWGNLTGDINLQDDLMALFRNINTNIEALDTSVSDLTNLINSKVEEIDEITEAVNNLSSDVSTLNSDMQSGFNNLANDISDVNTNIENHKEDINNPHQVTKDQVGLNNVDNTADIDKPLSTAQKEYIDNQISNVETNISNVDAKLNGFVKYSGEADNLYVGTKGYYDLIEDRTNIIAFILYNDYASSIIDTLTLAVSNTNYEASSSITLKNIFGGKYDGKIFTANVSSTITGINVVFNNIPEGLYNIEDMSISTNDGINKIKDISVQINESLSDTNLFTDILEIISGTIPNTNLWYETGISITNIYKTDDNTYTLNVIEALPDAPKQDYTCVRLGRTDEEIELGNYTIEYLDEGVSKTTTIDIVSNNIFTPIIVSKGGE